jgi:hypothetical protein
LTDRDLLAAAALTLLLIGPAAARGQVPPAVTAGQAASRVRLDGALDEPAWAVAGVIGELVQQSPRPGEPTAFATEVRLLVDGAALYVGFRCSDPEPRAIAAHTMQRDSAMDGDDSVAFVLDTFGDRTTAYLFRVNAAGARLDSLVARADSSSSNWDGIWDARVRRDASGWSAEIAIPSQTLRFSPGRDTWGFNAERYVARERTTLRWTGLTLDARLDDLRRAGLLAGVGGLEQGLGLSATPYALARSDHGATGNPRTSQVEIGGDLSYNLSSELTGVLTVNTDFAETDVDTRRVNLTRFPLFFPEKRAFFLEGSNQFDFGPGLGEDFVPFFSRRIGLFEGRQVPIAAGVKLVGRQGRWGIGLVDTLTDDVPGAPGSNLFGGRITYDADEHLRLGALATDGDPDGIHANHLVGVDAVWRTATFRGDKNLEVGGWYARSTGDVPAGRNDGFGLSVSYPNDLWDVSLTVKQFGEGLDPALGFLPRPGTRWLRPGLAYQPRPQKGWWATWIRQFYFELEPYLATTVGGDTESWRVFTAPFNAETTSGEHLEANWAPEFEHVAEPFEIANGIVIPAGDYHFNRYRVEAQTASSRPWSAGTTCWFGEFYGGHLTQLEAYASYAGRSGRLQLQLDTETDLGDLPAGDFIVRVWQLKAVFAFTPDLVLSAYTQYDSESRNLGLNTRLRWTVFPGTDLFLVVNRGWQRPLDEDGWTHLAPVSDQAIVKLRHTWRK